MKTTKQWTDTYGVSFEKTETEIGDRAFEGCDGLHCVLIPSSVTKIGFGAFNGCEYLRSTINEVPEKFKGNTLIMPYAVIIFSIALNFNYFCKTIKCTCKYDSLYC